MCVYMSVHWQDIDHLLPESCILKYALFINAIIRSVIYFSFIFIPRKNAVLVRESTRNNPYRNDLSSHWRLQYSLSEDPTKFDDE